MENISHTLCLKRRAKMKRLDQFEPSDLVKAIQNKNLTQKQWADIVHKNIRTWQKWEGGERPIDLASLELFLIKTKQIDF